MGAAIDEQVAVIRAAAAKASKSRDAALRFMKRAGIRQGSAVPRPKQHLRKSKRPD